jgi:LysM repeat protein
MTQVPNTPPKSDRLLKDILLFAGTLLLIGAVVIVIALAMWLISRPEDSATPVAQVSTLETNPATPTGTAASTITATATPQLPSPTPSPSVTSEAPTPTMQATSPLVQHVVAEGEVLGNIAALYNVSVEDLAAINEIADLDLIQVGQTLLIPSQQADDSPTIAATPQPTLAVTTDVNATSTPVLVSTPATGVDNAPQPAAWAPSLISGDIQGNYPLSAGVPSNALTLHYQPGTYPEQNLDWLAPSLDAIWADLLAQLGGSLAQQVDVYLAGTLFEVNPALQGFTQSGLYRTFILANGAFDRGEEEYILAHELAHIVATHTFGSPSSAMIHEGLALYLPQAYLVEGSGYLSYEAICAAAMQTPAFKTATQLNDLGYGASGFGGHIRTFINYNLSGCFVGYLIETYGLDNLRQVYSTGNYSAVYGKSLAELDAEWQASLGNTAVPVDPNAFIDLVDDVALAYETYVAESPGGNHADWQSYLHLNRARLAANRGQLDQAQSELDLFWGLMSG